MKLSINKNTLESAVLLCNAYVEKKDSSTITSHLLFEADEDKLIIRASDFEIGINYKIRKIRVESGGFATANAKSIADVIKSLNNEEVVLETIDNFLFIRQKSTKYKLPMFNHEDFPNFPKTEGKNQFDIDSSDLSRSLKKILPSIDTNNPKYSLNGAFLDIKTDRINFVGTDTRRLAVYTLEKTNNQEFHISIPKKAIMEMQKLFYEKIEIYYDENMLIA
ncbi:DNA polymerase III subunit beta, partial [Campylobacter coli]|nr:DNA polymerase III subunit beta [Campylobacter coli]EDO6961382.1 DNA polymerase III subunit beta [Campylobacter coli]